MRMAVPIEEVKKGDIVLRKGTKEYGRKAVEVAHRSWCRFVRLVLEGAIIADDVYGTMVEIEREVRK